MNPANYLALFLPFIFAISSQQIANTNNITSLVPSWRPINQTNTTSDPIFVNQQLQDEQGPWKPSFLATTTTASTAAVDPTNSNDLNTESTFKLGSIFGANRNHHDDHADRDIHHHHHYYHDNGNNNNHNPNPNDNLVVKANYDADSAAAAAAAVEPAVREEVSNLSDSYRWSSSSSLDRGRILSDADKYLYSPGVEDSGAEVEAAPGGYFTNQAIDFSDYLNKKLYPHLHQTSSPDHHHQPDQSFQPHHELSIDPIIRSTDYDGHHHHLNDASKFGNDENSMFECVLVPKKLPKTTITASAAAAADYIGKDFFGNHNYHLGAGGDLPIFDSHHLLPKPDHHNHHHQQRKYPSSLLNPIEPDTNIDQLYGGNMIHDGRPIISISTSAGKMADNDNVDNVDNMDNIDNHNHNHNDEDYVNDGGDPRGTKSDEKALKDFANFLYLDENYNKNHNNQRHLHHHRRKHRNKLSTPLESNQNNQALNLAEQSSGIKKSITLLVNTSANNNNNNNQNLNNNLRISGKSRKSTVGKQKLKSTTVKRKTKVNENSQNNYEKSDYKMRNSKAKKQSDALDTLRSSIDQLICYQDNHCYGAAIIDESGNDKLHQFVSDIRSSKKIFDLLEKQRHHLLPPQLGDDDLQRDGDGDEVDDEDDTHDNGGEEYYDNKNNSNDYDEDSSATGDDSDRDSSSNDDNYQQPKASSSYHHQHRSSSSIFGAEDLDSAILNNENHPSTIPRSSPPISQFPPHDKYYADHHHPHHYHDHHDHQHDPHHHQHHHHQQQHHHHQLHPHQSYHTSSLALSSAIGSAPSLSSSSSSASNFIKRKIFFNGKNRIANKLTSLFGGGGGNGGKIYSGFIPAEYNPPPPPRHHHHHHHHTSGSSGSGSGGNHYRRSGSGSGSGSILRPIRLSSNQLFAPLFGGSDRRVPYSAEIATALMAPGVLSRFSALSELGSSFSAASPSFSSSSSSSSSLPFSSSNSVYPPPPPPVSSSSSSSSSSSKNFVYSPPLSTSFSAPNFVYPSPVSSNFDAAAAALKQPSSLSFNPPPWPKPIFIIKEYEEYHDDDDDDDGDDEGNGVHDIKNGRVPESGSSEANPDYAENKGGDAGQH